MANNDYGKRGGTSVNAGKQRARYLVELPDGTTTIKATYSVAAPAAFAAVYQHDGKWRVSAIVDEPNGWYGQQQFIPARRLAE